MERCNEIVEEVKTVGKNKCSSCILYIVLFSIFFTIKVGIASYFVCCKYINHNKENISKYDYPYQSKNYQSYKMGEVKQMIINIFIIIFTTINLKHFEPNLLKIDRKSYKNFGIYNIGYIALKKIDDYESIYGVNPLHLPVNHANGYIEEKNGNKYLIFDSADENKELLKKHSDVWSGIKNKIEIINSGECDYEKGYRKIEFNSDDDLPLNKPLKFYAVTIIIRSVFEEDCKFYPLIFLDDALFELSI